MKQSKHMLAILIYFLASCFYLYEFALQVAPSVMVSELMQSMHIDAVGISWLAAAYYYAYAPMQIPAGILYDRFSARNLICLAIVMCVVGTFIFSSVSSLQAACVGRFLVGIGSAFSFVGILVLISNWFESKYYALLIGIAQLLSSVGVISGQYILANFIQRFGWREALIILALTGLVLAIFTWWVVRDGPEDLEHQPVEKKKQLSLPELLESFIAICRMPQTWLIALYAFVIWGPMTFFSSLWAVDYLKALYHFNTQEAIQYEMTLWIGVAVGCPLFGAFSNMISRRVFPMLLCGILGLIASLIMINSTQLSLTAMTMILFVLGVSAAGQTVSFGLVRDIQKHEHLGSASGFNNMATVAGGAILQPIMGLLIKHYWDGNIVNGIPVYNIATYQKALVLLPICYVTAIVLTLFLIKESYCEPQAEK